jgi:DNA-binding response OmpR family regulator
MRSDPRSMNTRTPIIMLTGNTEAHFVREALDAGINAYLIKPFSARTLATRIRALIERPRAFVASSRFRGPDRRYLDRGPPGGEDRRRRPPRGSASRKDRPHGR